ncbi:dna mismatch repair protein [Lichtheimia corymbifera JMRC:FSU:9682]|uniref:Dna mismatch repair protein n=1 Tax=Lichtheimia corymbifera JMRC:FSU:9682 TaxID=1263082 RepID=A0A068SEQ8_9FUNG|nr:dna mismatch repair protein [Lichtheimia corymbifera JMRC:FSU:9682]
MVEPLEQSVANQLRATQHITTLQQCLEQLVYNALDAQATLIDINFDAEKYSICVQDNGNGIRSDILPRLAQRHMTSKCHSLQDLQQVSTFGFRGEALANLAELGILQIVSRYANQTAMAIWKDGKLIETATCLERQNPGTTVTIRDLFFKFPARRRILTLTDRAIKRFVITTALAFPHVGFSVVDRDTKILSTKRCSSDMSLFRQVFGQPFAQNIRPYECYYDIVNRIHIPQNEVYKIISDAFNESSIMKDQDGFQLKKGKTKSRNVVDKHPVFVIHVEHPLLSTYDIITYRDAVPEHKGIHSELEKAIRLLTANFLRSHGFITSTSYQRFLDKQTISSSSSFPNAAATHSRQVLPISWHDPINGNLYQIQSRGSQSYVDRSHLRSKSLSPSTEPNLLHIPQRLHKDCLKDAEVFGQVDSKFIVIKVERTLLMVDQHAADERVQLERMLWSLKDNIQVIQLEPPIPIDLTDKERHLATKYMDHLQRWGIHLSLQHQTQQQQQRRASVETILFASPHFATPDVSPHFRQNQGALVTRLPHVIAERCLANHSLLGDMIREYIHWLEKNQQHVTDPESESFVFLRTCPPGMMQLMRSTACRGAIMFNDVLTHDQCCALIHALSQCRFPFQCVHGRPSMAPLATLSDTSPRRHRPINWNRFCK